MVIVKVLKESPEWPFVDVINGPFFVHAKEVNYHQSTIETEEAEVFGTSQGQKEHEWDVTMKVFVMWMA